MNNSRIVNLIFWFVLASVALIALGSFALSFSALHELAIGNGVSTRLGWIWPVIVDLSLVIYTAAILAAQLQHRGAKLPVALVIFYGIVTVVGNVIHAPATATGWFVAIMPPLSLILGTEVLRVMGKHIIERQAAVEALADLTGQATDLRADIERLTVRKEKLSADVGELKSQSYTGISDNTKQEALTILRNDPAISGTALGEALGRSGSTGRRLKRELTPIVSTNGHHTTGG